MMREHPKVWWSLHCAVISKYGSDVCKYGGTVFEWYLDACSHSVYLHQYIFISSFESYFSFQIEVTVYLDNRHNGGNHIMGEGQGLQPVNFKIIKLEINGGNFTCNVRMMKSIRSVHKLFVVL